MTYVLVWGTLFGGYFHENLEIWASEFGCRAALAEAQILAKPSYAYCIRVTLNPTPERAARPARWSTT